VDGGKGGKGEGRREKGEGRIRKGPGSAGRQSNIQCLLLA